MRKIFVIGFNKTATMTMHELFKSNGLNSYHGTEWILSKFDCFSDTGSLPFDGWDITASGAVFLHGGGEAEFQEKSYDKNNFSNLRDLEALYPDALFILNTRPLRRWLASRCIHGWTKAGRDGYTQTITESGLRFCDEGAKNWAAPMSDKLVTKWINDRNNYFTDVLEHFRGSPDKLIILNISEENWTQYISALLQLEVNHVESKNVTSYKYVGNVGKSFIDQVDNKLDSLLDKLGYDEYDEMIPLLKNNKDYLNIYKNNL